MKNAAHPLIFAVDGGGTRCRVAACAGRQVTVLETGSANVSTDFEGAVHQIERGVQAHLDRLGVSAEQLQQAPAFVGLAGVTGERIAARLRAALPFRHVRVADDRLAAVRGVLGRRDGVIAHCGTGSFYAAQRGGEIRLAGGLGPVLGDEASAQWVGRAALRLTAEMLDGRRSPTPLGKLLEADFDGLAGIIHYASTAQPADFGTLAPLVTEFAAAGDAMAMAIMQQGADEITRGLRYIGWRAGLVTCLTGGIGPYYAAYLPKDLQASFAAASGEPMDGAISLAQDFAKEIADERG